MIRLLLAAAAVAALAHAAPLGAQERPPPPESLDPATEPDFADGLAGGPDFWRVTTAGGALNLREAPSAEAAVLGRAENGATLANRGCRIAGARRWCRVATEGGLEAWAAGDYLRE